MTFIRTYKKYLTRAAILWAASLALCLLAYVILVRSQDNIDKRLERTLAEQTELYASAQRAAKQETRIQLNDEIGRLRDRVNGFVIDLEEATALTFDISQIGNRENLASLSVMTRAKPGAGRRSLAGKAQSDAKQISENHIDVKFSAGFQQFAAFMNALERHRPVLFIDEFKISLSPQNDSVYQVTLDVAALIRKQQNNDTAGEASTKSLSAKI